MMITAFGILAALLIGYVVGSFFAPVISKEGTTFARLSRLFRDSLTIFVARTMVFVGASGELVIQVLGALKAADIPAVRGYVGYMTVALAVLGPIVEAARRRTLDQPAPPAEPVNTPVEVKGDA